MSVPQGSISMTRSRIRTTTSDPKYHGEARYLQIRPDAQFVYSETIDADGVRLSASSVTVEFKSGNCGTEVKTTVQVTAFGGRDMIEDTKFGHNAAMTNLAKYLLPIV